MGRPFDSKRGIILLGDVPSRGEVGVDFRGDTLELDSGDIVELRDRDRLENGIRTGFLNSIFVAT